MFAPICNLQSAICNLKSELGLPLQGVETVVGRRDQLVGQMVELALDLADAFGPLMSIIRKALMDQFTQRLGRLGIELLYRLEEPLPGLLIQRQSAVFLREGA